MLGLGLLVEVQIAALRYNSLSDFQYSDKADSYYLCFPDDTRVHQPLKEAVQLHPDQLFV